MKINSCSCRSCNAFLLLFVTIFFASGIFAQTTLTTRATGNWDANDTWISGNLTGTITTLTSSSTVTGVGTSFTTQLATGAALYRTDGTTLIGTVQSISSNTSLVLTANAANANTAANFRTRKVPGANDPVVMSNNGFNVTIPSGVAAACASLNIGVTGTNSAEALTFSAASSSLDVNGNLTIFGPTGNSVRAISVNTGSLNVDGNLSMGDGNTGAQGNRITRITITTGSATVAGNLTFNTGANAAQAQIIMSGGAGSFNLAGSFTSTNSVGTLTAGTSSIFNFNGTSAQTIPIGVSSIIYNHIHTNNTNASGAALSSAVTAANVTGTIRVQSGTFSNGGFAIAGNSGQKFVVANSATFNIAGTTSSFPSGFGTDSLGATSTVVYNGSGNQTVYDVASPGYGNLSFSNGGNKTAPTALDIQGAVTLGSGSTFVGGSLTHNIQGNWINNGGGFTSTGTGINLNGTAAQTIGGTANSTFNNLTLNNSNGFILSRPTTVNGTLTLTSGIVDATGNTLTVGWQSSENISGGSSTANINGKLARVFSTTAASRTFPVSKSGNYRLLTLNFTGNPGSRTVTAEQFESNFPSALTGVRRFSRYWNLAQSSAGGSAFTVTVNGTGFSPTGTAVMLRREGTGTPNSNTVSFSSPDYTNALSFAATTDVSNDFGLGQINIPLTVTGVLANDKVYNGNTNAVLNNTSAALSGVISPDVVNLSTAGTTGTFATANVGNNIAVTTSGYSISGADAAYYSLTQPSATANITGLPIGGADFRSKASGNFSSISKWEYDQGGGNWQNATQAPGLSNNITVQNGHAITLDVDHQVGSGKTLLISDGSIVIEPGKGLSVASGGTLNFNGKSVTVRSTSAGTGSIGKINGTLSGESNVTIERYIPAAPRRAYRLLSVPTTGQTIREAWQEGAVNGARQNNIPGYGTWITGVAANLAAAEAAGFDTITPAASLRSYNGSAFVAVTNTNDPISNHSAYFLYIRGDRTQGPNNSGLFTNATTLRTTGTMYKGNQATTGIGNGQFALIGNLYPSAVEFTSLTKSNVANTFYLWDAQKGPGAGAYETFSATNDFKSIVGGGSWNYGDSNSVIQSGHAFFVIGAGGGGSVTLNENSKITGSNNRGFRPTSSSKKTVRLNVRLLNTEGKPYDGNVVVFDKAYSHDVNADDAVKFENPAENFGIARSNKILAVEARPELKGEEIIAFDMKNMKQQQYTIEYKSENIPAGFTAYLEDSYSGIKTPVELNTTGTITFAVTADAASATAKRFKLVLKPAVVIVNSIPSIKISPNPVEGSVMNLKLTQQAKGKYHIKLVDLVGRVVYSIVTEHFGGSAAHSVVLPAGIAPGTYNAVITGPGKTKQTEKILLSLGK